MAMRTSSVLLLAVVAIFFGFTSALSTVTDSKVAVAEVGRSLTEVDQPHGTDKKVLRFLKADEEDQNEERAVSFSWLTKLFPGTAAYKAAAVARKAEEKKFVQLFTVVDTTDHAIFRKFEQWFTAEKSVGEAVNAMVKVGKSAADAQKIGGRYERWLATKKAKSLLN